MAKQKKSKLSMMFDSKVESLPEGFDTDDSNFAEGERYYHESESERIDEEMADGNIFDDESEWD